MTASHPVTAGIDDTSSEVGTMAGKSSRSGTSRSTSTTAKAAARVQSAVARNPASRSAKTGLAPRMQSAAARDTSRAGSRRWWRGIH